MEKFTGTLPRLITLKSVKPNDWNPNQMTPELYESLRVGIVRDGWLSSQAMLIWGTDENGVEQNIIIDGEHRWRVGVDLGMPKGPAVILDGITRAKAMALTVKLDQKHGEANKDRLSALLREIGSSADPGELGFNDAEMAELLKPPDVSGGIPATPSENAHVKVVPLYMSAAQHEEFVDRVRKLGTAWKIDNVTDVVKEAMNNALEA